MLPLPSLRLPSRSELELAGLVVIAGLCALYANERGKVAARDAVIAARPMVDERREVKEEKGPTTTTRKYGPPPAPTPACPRPLPVLLEEVISEGPSKREESFARRETPLSLPERAAPWRFAHLDIDPRTRQPVGGDFGVTFAQHFDAGAWYYHPARAAGVKVGGRW